MARQFTKGIDLKRAQEERFARLKMTRAQGLRDIAQAGKQDAIQLASGGLSKKQTRGAFARGASPSERTDNGRRRQLSSRQLANRGIAGGVPFLPINVQSGKLQHGIRLVLRSSGPRLRYDLLVSGVGYAKYILSVEGTKKMQARGYKTEVKRRQAARMAAFVQFYVRKQRST